jgi:GT2 family glycosyltransferase
VAELSGPAPDLSVVIVNWNTRDILHDALASVQKHLGAIPHETIVVDNASADGSADMVASAFPSIRLIRNAENVGFARANNQAMKGARGKWFLLLNSDILLTDDSVAGVVDRVRADPTIGIAHCRLVMGDGRFQYTTYRFPGIGLALLEDFGLYKLLSPARRAATLLGGYWDQTYERDVDWVAGAFMLLPREVFEQTGGFSEAYFMYGEDMEWCYRIRDAGWRIRYFPQATIVHLDHQSSAIRWGDRRIAICLQRQLEIYARRQGRVQGFLFHLVKTAGAGFRVGYFSLRSLFGGGKADYYREMRRYHLLCFRTIAGLLVGNR